MCDASSANPEAPLMGPHPKTCSLFQGAQSILLMELSSQEDRRKRTSRIFCPLSVENGPLLPQERQIPPGQTGKPDCQSLLRGLAPWTGPNQSQNRGRRHSRKEHSSAGSQQGKGLVPCGVRRGLRLSVRSRFSDLEARPAGGVL